MTNIKISDKGKAFLKKGNLGVQVVSAIAAHREDLQSEEGVVVHVNEHKIIVRSASNYPELVKAS